MTDIELSCKCGEVEGIVHHASPNTGNRLICYCDSCRKFAEHVDAEGVLDEYGGTDIYQVPVSHVELTKGVDKIRCLNATKDGPFRWYASCCNSLIGNTGTPKFPFMGVIHSCMKDDGRLEQILGPVRIDANPQDAQQPLPKERQRGSMFLFLPRFLVQILSWKIQGKGQPNPVFDENGDPVVEPVLI